MKKLNIHTYEAWLLDYHEGNLNADEKQALFAFMAANPYLQWGEHELSDTTLKPKNEVFQLKNKLHKNEFGLETKESELEYKMIALVEGLLTKTEAETFENKLSNEENKTLKHYKATKLKASEVFYPHKKAHYKRGKSVWFFNSAYTINKELFGYAASLLGVMLAAAWLLYPQPNARYDERIAFLQVGDFTMDLNDTLTKAIPEKRIIPMDIIAFEEKQNSPTLKKKSDLALHLQAKENTNLALHTPHNIQLDIVNRTNTSDFFVEENYSETETMDSPEETFKTKTRIKNALAAITKPLKTKIDEQVRFEELQNEKGYIVAWELALGPVQIKRNLK